MPHEPGQRLHRTRLLLDAPGIRAPHRAHEIVERMIDADRRLNLAVFLVDDDVAPELVRVELVADLQRVIGLLALVRVTDEIRPGIRRLDDQLFTFER